MLVGHDVVLVLGVDGAVLRRDPDVVVRETGVRAAEVLEQVRVPGRVEVDLGVARVFVLGQGSAGKKGEGGKSWGDDVGLWVGWMDLFVYGEVFKIAGYATMVFFIRGQASGRNRTWKSWNLPL